MKTIETRLHERMTGDYSTATIEHDGTTYLITLGTGEMHYGRDGGECAYAYDVEDVENLLAESDIEVDYSGDFCARLSPVEDRELAILCAMREFRLTEGGSCKPVLSDDTYAAVRTVLRLQGAA